MMPSLDRRTLLAGTRRRGVQLAAATLSLVLALLLVGAASAQATDTTPPVFSGLKEAWTCIPGPVEVGVRTHYHLTWEAATDDVTPSSEIVYRIYFATRAGHENFSKPRWTTVPGATSFETPKLPSEKSFFVVRARDQAGNEDGNTVERRGFNVCE
jgi:hypothetical protein